MKAIIEWLSRLEEMACALYTEAAQALAGDERFALFLKALAADEAMHIECIRAAAEHTRDLDSRDNAITLDAALCARVEKPFHELDVRLSEGRLTRREMSDYIARMEFSEWNDVFIYVVQTLQGRNPEFMRAASLMEQHRKYVEAVLRTLPEADGLDQTVGGRPLWRETILVVDDSPSVTTLLQRLLEREGFRVVTASNGREALDPLSRDYFDVVISDLDMNVMNGMTLFREGRKLVPDLAERFLVFSGWIGGTERAFLKRHGLRYVEKPAGISRIVEVTRDMIRRCSSHPVPFSVVSGADQNGHRLPAV
jgi:CheY-like chemotaxis protein